MKKVLGATDYFNSVLKFSEELNLLRKIVLKSGLTENVKWGAPTYSYGKENVLSMHAFKTHFCLWFYQGSLLGDPSKLLFNASSENTIALRQLRMHNLNDIDEKQILSFIYESIENFKQGRKITANRTKELTLPIELSEFLANNKEHKSKFEGMNLSKRREFCEYIEVAKRLETKQARLLKIAPMIISGIGLNDKYR